MDLNYNTINLFPVLVHQFDVNGFDEVQNELIDYSYSKRKDDPKGVCISNRGGWQSQDFDVTNKDDVLQSFLANCLSVFPPIKKSTDLYVNGWININEPNGQNVKHNHPGAMLAGVLWIKCPKNCGDILFDNPTGFNSYNEINSYTTDFKDKFNFHHSYFFPPTEGRMLIFPAYLEHLVKENKSNEDRISVSFNIRLANESRI